MNKIKGQLIEWEKIFTNNATERCYFPKYINFSHNCELNTKKIKKCAEDFNIFPKKIYRWLTDT